MPKKPKVKKSGDAGKRLNSFEHCLLRPDLYIGSVITTTKKAWIYKDPEVIDANDEDDVSTTERDDCTDEGEEGSGESPESKSKDDGTRVIFKTIKYNPGLVSIIREIISNAIDNLWRSKDHGVVMKYIKIALDRDEHRQPLVGSLSKMTDTASLCKRLSMSSKIIVPKRPLPKNSTPRKCFSERCSPVPISKTTPNAKHRERMVWVPKQRWSFQKR